MELGVLPDLASTSVTTAASTWLLLLLLLEHAPSYNVYDIE
jgi:hypothetical protein